VKKSALTLQAETP